MHKLAQSLGLVGFLVLGLSGCGSTPEKLQPAPLGSPATVLDAAQVWTAKIGESAAPLAPVVVGGRVFVASAKGNVAALDAETGRDIWRVSLNAELGAGVGADGQSAAVITRDNDLVTLRDGREVWRIRLPARSFTAPLVAGGRVFVLMADRSVGAYDGSTGARLWTQSRPSEPLVLGQGGVLLAVGNTLVAGLSARMTGLDPSNGNVQWQALLASSRGTNEVERLVDLVGSVSREGESVCARAFGAAVGCVDTSRGATIWSKVAKGSNGVSGDATRVFATESDGSVQAWQRDNGEAAWRVDRLKFRDLTAPKAVGRAVVIGDANGNVHVLSREDGSDMARFTTDGSAILGAPVVSDQVLIVQTQKGGVYAWRPR
ncbi:outer membrane protein assembly factor BamB [Hydrogenophaga crassostreae]|uniref:Outer membrane protein assembly factor BamB n=1 Tax=Hydrogenophaga crassostreae TaxID=1763535 RepID=A0A162P8Y5_9BURK|nr:outer membrane protein assembly factor BamB [Hydrogenophaga crassostreae]AOW13266.1 outer membrane protein assembly factor BamB [Hydrogenophaga crassostreae]OAD42586.1 outer membrane protein assembly factor BamB [Hydrogenophaga crassostreae]